MIRISLVVPTYNRANYLLKSIPSFLDQTIPAHMYEILVIDNNSSDNTKEVVHSILHSAECSWRYVFEKRQGLHFARNKGILLSEGEIVVFGDDDIEASPAWLVSILNSFEKDKRIGIVGGPIYPIWDGEAPEWIYDYGTKDTHPVFAYLNYGGESKYLEKEDLFGCNFAIRKTIAMEVKGSGPDTFPGSLIHYSGTGESAMLIRAKNKGYKVYYNAQAYVKHYAPVSRCNLNYFINRYQRWAVENLYHQYNMSISLFNIFLNLINQTIDLSKSLAKLLVRNNRTDRGKYFIIMTKYMLFSWKHYCKLLFDPNLREYTRRTDYLEELSH